MVFRHCVMFKWVDDVSEQTKAAVRTGLDELSKLGVVANYDHGPDAGVSDGNWDYVVVADFATVDDYRVYAVDDTHLDLIANLIKPNIVGRAAVQYEI